MLREKPSLGNSTKMRIANFKMGFEPSVDYGTTTDANNVFFLQESNIAEVGKTR